MKKDRAVIYGRYSDEGQQVESIETQIAKCNEYAEQHGLKIKKHYIDEGLTASTKIEKREDFNNLIRDSKKDLFDVVLVHKIDRFARDSVDFLVTEKALNEVGVKVITVATPFEDDPTGILMKQIMIAQAEFFSRNLSDEVRTKSMQHASKGKNMGGKANYGYKYDENGNYQIEESEAYIVRKIYQLYLNGYGYKAIANNLNEAGYRNRGGNLFAKNHIGAIIRSEKYKGCYVYGKHISDFKTKKKYKNKEPIILDNKIPAIVSQEIWDRCERLRTKKDKDLEFNFKAKNRKDKLHDFILTGYLTCKECGSRMRGSSHSTEHSYYRCSRRSEKGDLACTAKAVRADVLESIVLYNIKNYVFTDEMIEFYTKSLLEMLNADKGEDINIFIAKKDELQEAKDKLLSVYLSPKSRMSEDKYIEQDNDLHDQIEAIEAKIYELKASASTLITADEIKQYLQSLKNETATSEEARALIMAVVNNVIVDRKSGNVELVFNVYNPKHYVSKGANGKPNDTLYTMENMQLLEHDDNVILGHLMLDLPEPPRTSWK